MNAWLFPAAAIALEIVGTFLLKLSDGFAKPLWGGLSILCYSACFWMLAPAMKALPLGVVYAIWSGIGIAAAALIGAAVFAERLGIVQFVLIAVIMVAAILLQLITNDAA